MRQNIIFEDGNVTLGGKAVPGILTELRVDCKVRFDEHKVDGLSGKTKIPQGYEDSDVMVGLLLVTDDASTCYDKAIELSGLFRDTDPRANPQVLTVINRHIQARGIKQVVFSRLETAEDDQTDEIRATLAFVEHMPPIIKDEKAEARTPTAGEVAKANDAKTGGAAPEADDTLTIDGN